jgi:hypothetical protein
MTALGAAGSFTLKGTVIFTLLRKSMQLLLSSLAPKLYRPTEGDSRLKVPEALVVRGVASAVV